jgi:hypothetical protein
LASKRLATSSEQRAPIRLSTDRAVRGSPGRAANAAPNWTVGEIVPVGRGKRLRILAIDTDISEELVDAGFNGIFTVQAV